MRIKLMILLLASLVIPLISGCYESPGVTVHEPGVYKGPVDPLLAMQATSEQQNALKERFSQVQTDR